MYISTSTYGGMDFDDYHTIYQQLKNNGSYYVEEQKVPDVIADDITQHFPYTENIRENILKALSEKSVFRFMIKSEEKDSAGNVFYKDCEMNEINGHIYYESEATFDGGERTLTQDYAYGRVSYITAFQIDDIPDDQLGYIVTEDFLAPAKGVPVVERLYHDIFDDQEAVQIYAENLKLHDFYPKSITTFLICNRSTVIRTVWYRQQKEAMNLMEEKGQTYLDDSFCIFTQSHIEDLKKLTTKETA